VVANYENRAFNPNNLDSRIATGGTGGYSLFVSFRNSDVNGAIPQAVATTVLAPPLLHLAYRDLMKKPTPAA
jgi:hypothetical protein